MSLSCPGSLCFFTPFTLYFPTFPSRGLLHPHAPLLPISLINLTVYFPAPTLCQNVNDYYCFFLLIWIRLLAWIWYSNFTCYQFPVSRAWTDPIPGQLALHKEKRTLSAAASCRITFITTLDSSWYLSLPLQIRESEANSFLISQGWSQSSPHPGICPSHWTDWPMFICRWHGILLNFSHYIFMFEFLLPKKNTKNCTHGGSVCGIWRPSQHLKVIVVLLKPFLDHFCFAVRIILLKRGDSHQGILLPWRSVHGLQQC